MCTNTSSTYQAFLLNSPLISSVSSPQISNFSNNPQISSTNPLAIPEQKVIQLDIYFPSPYQVMEIHLQTTNILNYFLGRTGDSKPQLTGVIISSSDVFVEYLITVVLSSTQPTNELSLTIYTAQATNITLLTIIACTGNIFLSMNLCYMKSND